jgi:hypothetical protein
MTSHHCREPLLTLLLPQLLQLQQVKQTHYERRHIRGLSKGQHLCHMLLSRLLLLLLQLPQRLTGSHQKLAPQPCLAPDQQHLLLLLAGTHL